MFMVFLVLDNPDQLEDVLQAWEGAAYAGRPSSKAPAFTAN